MEISDRDNWIVCFGGEDWWYHSHAHFDIQIMKHFSKKANVLYVNAIGMRMPSLRKDKLFWLRIKRKLSSVSQLVKRITPQLYVYSPLPLPLYQYQLGSALNTLILRFQLRLVFRALGVRSPVIWVTLPTAWSVIDTLSSNGLVYQRTDDHAAYDFDNFNVSHVRKLDDMLVRKADLVIHVSDELHDEASKITKRSLLLPQGVDPIFFGYKGEMPVDLDKIPRPVIGYVGGMDKYKFDTPLIAKVARNLPNCSFVLIGLPSPNVDELRNLPNVYFLGVKSHDDIPAYVHNFDVCMLPTAKTEWGLKCRPIKLMEYLAAGKPVVATATPASAKFEDALYIADNVSAWVDAIRHIIHPSTEGIDTVNLSNRLLKPWNTLADQLWNCLYKTKLD